MKLGDGDTDLGLLESSPWKALLAHHRASDNLYEDQCGVTGETQEFDSSETRDENKTNSLRTLERG